MVKLEDKPLGYWQEKGPDGKPGAGWKLIHRLETDPKYTPAQAAKDATTSRDAVYKALEDRREKGIGGITAAQRERAERKRALGRPLKNSDRALSAKEKQLSALGASIIKTLQEETAAALSKAQTAFAEALGKERARADDAERRAADLEAIVSQMRGLMRSQEKALAQSKDVYKES